MTEGLGDLSSTAKGTAARYNKGKTAVELIPLWIPAATHLLVLRPGAAPRNISDPDTIYWPEDLREMLSLLSDFQIRQAEGDALLKMLSLLGMEVWKDCADVFEYGRNKYAAWNWAKGFPWSSVIGCAGRHLLFGMMRGEARDAESGLPHRGHLACNLVMLLTFIESFPEGDDRPPKEYFDPVIPGSTTTSDFAETVLAPR